MLLGGIILGAPIGCQDDPVDVEPMPHRIEMEPDAVTLLLGDTLRMGVIVVSKHGVPVEVQGSWFSTDSTVVLVDTTGLTVAVAEGHAQVSFEAAGLIASADIEVSARELQWTAASAGCAVREEQLYCWGWGTDGLGAPVAMLPSERFVQVDHNNGHACAVAVNATIYCWGSNIYGQLGDGTTVDHQSPARVSSEHRFVHVAVGIQHTCGLTVDGSAYCWGNNTFGQLGAADNGERCDHHPCRRLPVRVQFDQHLTAIDAGGYDRVGLESRGFGATCAIGEDGRGFCWGANTQGILGDGLPLPDDGTFSHSSIPMPIAGGHEFAAISVGGVHACGVTIGREVYCWGSNGDWQLAAEGLPHEPPTLCRAADVVWTCSSTPVLIDLHGAAIGVAAAGLHSCARLWHGGVQCWGINTLDNVNLAGSEPQNHFRVPTEVANGRTFLQVSGRGTVTCGISTAGDVVCWGAGHNPQVLRAPVLPPSP